MSSSRALILDLMQLCVTEHGQLSWVLGNVCVLPRGVGAHHKLTLLQETSVTLRTAH